MRRVRTDRQTKRDAYWPVRPEAESLCVAGVTAAPSAANGRWAEEEEAWASFWQ